MLVLIDESGDPGFRLDKGSTRHFVAAMVVFRDYKQAEACSQAIKDLRLQLPHSGEFKFNKSDSRVKDGFLEAVHPHSFEVWALGIDNFDDAPHHLLLRFLICRALKGSVALSVTRSVLCMACWSCARHSRAQRIRAGLRLCLAPVVKACSLHRGWDFAARQQLDRICHTSCCSRQTVMAIPGCRTRWPRGCHHVLAHWHLPA